MALGGLGDAECMRGRMLSARDHFRRCVELSRQHGFGRIEVANWPMLAFTLWFADGASGALSEALAAIEAGAGRTPARRDHRATHRLFLSARAERTNGAWGHVERALALEKASGAPLRGAGVGLSRRAASLGRTALGRARRRERGPFDEPRDRNDVHGAMHPRHSRARYRRPSSATRPSRKAGALGGGIAQLQPPRVPAGRHRGYASGLPIGIAPTAMRPRSRSSLVRVDPLDRLHRIARAGARCMGRGGRDDSWRPNSPD